MNYRKRNTEAKPLKDVIDKLMKAYRLDKRMQQMDVVQAWPELMGVAVANRTREICIKEKTLVLKMDSAVMRDELANGREIIIHRVNDFAGFEIINNIWFA